ncbi:MAG: hypothetical protein ACT4P1_01160 [Sporichthyaceae bacterium]
MPKVLFAPRWVALHVLTVAAVVTCLALSWWQFGRSGAGGGGSSLGYALQWPAFGLFTLGVWAWLCREAIRAQCPGHEQTAPPRHPGYRLPDDVVLPPARPTAATQPTDSDLESDSELAAFNDLLARLHQKDHS